MDAVLIVGAGMLQVPMIQDAQALGLAVIATDANPDAPGVALAEAFFPIDTYDMVGHETLGKTLVDQDQWQVRGVVTCGADVAPSVAAAAKALGVQGIPLDVALTTHNKFQVRKTLTAAGLDQYQPRCSHIDKPAYDQWVVASIYTQGSAAWHYIQQAYKIPLPWVIKPLEQRASRGVSIVQTYEEYKAALDKVSVFDSHFLVEERLRGSEHSAEVIFGPSGETYWFNIVDRFFDYSSGVPIETGHINPTMLNEHQQQQVLLMTLAAARALGVTWGPFKVDCMMTPTGPKILEVTARLSGGWDCQWSSPATGRHPMRMLLQLACGLPVTRQPQMRDAHGYGAVAAILPEKHGQLWAVHIPEEALDRTVMMTVKEGDVIRPLAHNGMRCGYVMAHRDTALDAWDAAVEVANAIAAQMDIL